jgi:asparaginyl-tRNA synthetase
MIRTKIKDILFPEKTSELLGKKIRVCGWIKTARDQKSFCFIELNDGSTQGNLQIIAEQTLHGYKDLAPRFTTGASFAVTGVLIESPGKNQALELKAEEVHIFGDSDPQKYLLQKKRHSFEFLRSIAHLRPRTNTQGAVTRIRNALAFATHLFFQERGFLYIQTPIITASDCEGAGEMFQVTTLDPLSKKTGEEANDYSKDFFKKPAYLTVSGQLNGEIYACALSDIYTFGPTFRAENSNTSRHLAEFWMIEPEMAFCDLKGNMQCAESYIKFVTEYTLKHCKEDMLFLDKYIENGLIQRLEHVIHSSFAHLTYTDAIKILEKAPKKFEFPVHWGVDLQSEHERYLAEEHCKKPVILTDYPAAIKSFYMKMNEDQKTVAAMDILVPKIGELVGGSQREDRLSLLEKRITDAGLKKEDYWWYLELREYGSVPHSGFGVGFERLVLFVTGMENIRDVIPFPRYPGHIEF